jgi:hypothetical protein
VDDAPTFQPLEKIVARAVLDAPAQGGIRRQFGQLAMEGPVSKSRARGASAQAIEHKSRH